MTVLGTLGRPSSLRFQLNWVATAVFAGCPEQVARLVVTPKLPHEHGHGSLP